MFPKSKDNDARLLQWLIPSKSYLTSIFLILFFVRSKCKNERYDSLLNAKERDSTPNLPILLPSSSNFRFWSFSS